MELVFLDASGDPVACSLHDLPEDPETVLEFLSGAAQRLPAWLQMAKVAAAAELRACVDVCVGGCGGGGGMVA